MKKFSINKLISILIITIAYIFLCGCANKVCLDKYLSENRTEVYYAEKDDFYLTAYYSQKEYPYIADGIVGELSSVLEIQIKAPNNSLDYNICFTLSNVEYKGETSFDSVRQIYTFCVSTAKPETHQINFILTTENTEISLIATSVKNKETLSYNLILEKFQASEKELLNSLVQNRILAAEIYLRLVFKDGEVFYYLALFDRGGNQYSYLIDSITGEILASKQN